MKKILIFITAIILIFSLSSCSSSTGVKDYEIHSNLKAISSNDNLYYDQNTKIVYILFNEAFGYTGYGYMSAYFAPNGKPYLYDVETNSLCEIPD